MTALRPEQDGSGAAAPEPPGGAGPARPPAGEPAGAAGPGRPGREYDPLTDPLPTGGPGSPWFRAEETAQRPAAQDPPQDWYGREAVYEPIAPPAPATPVHRSAAAPATPEPFPGPDGSTAVFPAVRDDETVGLRVAGAAPASSAPAGADLPPVPTGGRAERRKAAKGRGRKSAAPAEPVIPAIPRTRMEARLAARALKDSPAVIASRAIGEIFISLGVLMLLFVTYQLWWTNVRAHQEASGTAHSLQDNWAKGGDKKGAPGAFEPGQGFAIIHIPKLDVVVPIAEGVSKTKVLDRGMVGHYSEGKLRTAMPSAKTGNFALAGHRNTHGEPFRYINKLKDGDKVVVETRDDYYTYEVTSRLAQTSPANVSVIQPVPVGSGFTRPGRYITLTTCTPEFTSTYRMVVWGKMVDERPRSKGMPEALTAG
ncbi:class E sortase [Streptomyces sp. NBC_01180]|uniref:class E sortase n=1 Tax=Streptomyces sp. NBC_01180 TaxID=2903763 RepID=UPI003866787C